MTSPAWEELSQNPHQSSVSTTAPPITTVSSTIAIPTPSPVIVTTPTYTPVRHQGGEISSKDRAGSTRPTGVSPARGRISSASFLYSGGGAGGSGGDRSYVAADIGASRGFLVVAVVGLRMVLVFGGGGGGGALDGGGGGSGRDRLF